MTLSLFSLFSSRKKPNLRRVPRYGVGSLRVWIQKPGLLGMFENHVELTPIDFNQTGMAFRHQHLLIPGQTVVLDIDKDNLSLTGLVATVCYTSQLANHYRSGVEFKFDANDHMGSPDLKKTLVDIEAVLKEVVVLSEI